MSLSGFYSIFSRYRAEFSKAEGSFSLSFKGNLSLTAQYVADGRILILPIKGSGDALVEARKYNTRHIKFFWIMHILFLSFRDKHWNYYAYVFGLRLGTYLQCSRSLITCCLANRKNGPRICTYFSSFYFFTLIRYNLILQATNALNRIQSWTYKSVLNLYKNKLQGIWLPQFTEGVEVRIDSKLVHDKDSNGDHFQLATPKYKYTIERTTFDLKNLFNGNKQLGEY